MRSVAIACITAGAFLLAGCGGRHAEENGAHAAAACLSTPGGTVSIKGARIRETSTPGATTVAYLTICNGGQSPVELVGAATPIAASTELHETLTSADGVASMRPLSSIELQPGASIELKPGGAHLMIFGVTEPLAAGGRATLTLKFDDGTTLETSAQAMSLADAASAEHEHH